MRAPLRQAVGGILAKVREYVHAAAELTRERLGVGEHAASLRRLADVADDQGAAKRVVLDESQAGAVARGDRLLDQAQVALLVVAHAQPSLCGPARPPCRENSSSDMRTVAGCRLDRAKSSHIGRPGYTCCPIQRVSEPLSMTPETRAVSRPSLKRISVGMPRMFMRAASA